MKRKRLAVFLLFIIFISISVISKKDLPFISPKIYSQEGENIPVVIKLKDNVLPANRIHENNKSEIIKEYQDSFIKETKKQGKFIIKRRFIESNIVSATISKQIISSLEKNNMIEAIYYDNRLNIFLNESTQLMGVESFWNISINNVSINGSGETVCIIDTGIDYSHHDLGGCTISNNLQDGENISYILESDHPYSNNIKQTFKINYTGFSRIAVHFAVLSTESEWDFIKILDPNNNNNTIATYTGTHTDIWTPSVEGDTIYVLLETDENTEEYGFVIDAIQNGTINTTLNWSSCEKVIGGWDFSGATQAQDGEDPMDDNGHGTHVAGIIASTNNTYPGVAKGVKIVAVKAMNSSGRGSSTDVAAAILFCTENKDRLNISVISMSLGEGSYSDYCDSTYSWFSDIVQKAIDKDIMVVIAAGNSGDSTGIGFPACLKNVTSVSSVTKSNLLSSFSQTSSILDLFAYGSSITSTKLSGGYLSDSGTSMATPHAAGAALLIKNFKRNENKSILTPSQTEYFLKTSGINITDSRNGLSFPLINLTKAIQLIDDLPRINFIQNEANNSNISVNFSFVNLNSSEPLTNITLVLDSFFNYSLYGSVNYSYNMTNLSEGIHNYSIFAYDITGNYIDTGIYFFYVDTILPRSVFDLDAYTIDDGSIYLNWSKVVYDINNNTEQAVDYYIYRTENFSALNISSEEERIAFIENEEFLLVYNYTDINITTGSNYTYIIITLDNLGNLNDSISTGNHLNITPKNCNSSFSEWSDWSSCISDIKTRTRERICYGNSSQETLQSENETCTTIIRSGGRTSGGSRIVGTSFSPSLTSASWTWASMNTNLISSFNITTKELAIKQIKVNVSENLSNVRISVIRIDNVSKEKIEIKNKTYMYLNISVNKNNSKIKESEILFSVNRSWLDENNITPERISLFRFTKEWQQLNTSIYSENLSQITYLSFSPGFSYYAIAETDINESAEKEEIKEIEDVKKEKLNPILSIYDENNLTEEKSDIDKTAENKNNIITSLPLKILLIVLIGVLLLFSLYLYQKKN